MEFRSFFLKIITAGMLLGFTPAINTMQPVEKLDSGLWSSLSQSAWTATKYSTLASLAAAGLGVWYLSKKRASMQNWALAIEGAHAKTQFINSSRGVPQSLEFWRIYTAGNLLGWKTAADIMAQKETVYAAFRQQFIMHGEPEADFINRMARYIDIEKGKYLGLLRHVELCLADCAILPKLPASDESTQIIDAIILAKKRELRCEHIQRFIDLTAAQVAHINNEVMRVSSVSWLSPYALVRHWILPHESDAIRECWKIHQLIARLDALQECLTHAQSQLRPRI